MSNNTIIDFNIIKASLSKEHDILTPFNSNTDYITLIQTIHSSIKQPNNREHSLIIASITDLRRLLKYEPKLFTLIYDNINENISNLLDRFDNYPSLILHILYLSYEVFSAYPDNENWYINSVTSLLQISTQQQETNSDKQSCSIIQLTNVILMVLTSNSIFDTSFFDVLVNYFDNDNKIIALKAAELAYDIVFKLDNTSRIESIQWANLIQKAINILLNDVDNNIKESHGMIVIKKFIHSIKGLFNEDEWIRILSRATNQHLQTFTLIEQFDMKKVLAKKKQIELEFGEY